MTTFGIVVGGGPAPGINGVIESAATAALSRGDRVIGCYDGFSWLMQGSADHVIELSLADIEKIHLQGGSILHTSRANPTKNPEHLQNVVKSLDALGIDHLITIGGDDTAFSAKRVADTGAGRIRVAHVPKTIDNDLPLPEGVPTFGFETARDHASMVVENLIEDCRTTNRWFFVILMGRKSGSLALGAGMAAGAPVSVIPEEFPGDVIRLADVVRVIEGSVIKRLSVGRRDGVAVIAEGVAERFDPSDLEMLKDVERDEHGHIRLAEVPLGKVLRNAVSESLATRGIKIATGEKDVGYELRCGKPCAFDRDYTRDLGAGAVVMLLEGQTDVMITRQSNRIVTVPFSDLMDPETGRTRVRMVDIESDWFRCARLLQTRVEPSDLTDAASRERLAKAGNFTEDEFVKHFS